MGEWKEYTVDEFADVIGGGTPKTSIEAFWGGEIPWISPKDLSDYNDRRIQRGERNISSEGLKSSSAKILPKNSVLLTSRAPVGYLAIADNEITTNQGFRSLVVKEDFDFLFVYYLLKNNVEYLKQHATGSTFQELSGSTLKALKFRLPEDKKQQQKISSILSSLDDKIELNRKMNETLEEMARAIFKSWFVDFDPVHAKARGEEPSGMPDEIASLFPSEFVHSEQLNNPIPKGWLVKPLKELIDFNPVRKLLKGSVVPYVEMSSLPEQGMSIKSFYEREFKSGSKFVNGDTLFARITPCLENGKTAFVDCLKDSEVGWGSTEFIVMRSKDGIGEFFSYLVARSDWFRTVAIGSMTGSSGRQRASKEALEELLVVVPSGTVFKAFNDIVEKIPEKIKSSHRESQTLTKLRDSLLPKLISGEIEV